MYFLRPDIITTQTRKSSNTGRVINKRYGTLKKTVKKIFAE